MKNSNETKIFPRNPIKRGEQKKIRSILCGCGNTGRLQSRRQPPPPELELMFVRLKKKSQLVSRIVVSKFYQLGESDK